MILVFVLRNFLETHCTNENLSLFHRYIRNAVCTYLPRNLNVKWTFVNTYFPDNDEKFHLEGTENRKFRILTEYGVVDVNEEYTEEQIPDFAIYLKYLIFKLCATVFDALNPVTGLQIMKEVCLVKCIPAWIR